MFVTGCHRSGTSLVASLVTDLLGHSASALQLSPQLDNPQGFFESRQLVDLNNDLLAWLGRDWSRPPLLAPRWDQSPLLDRLAERRAQVKQWALERAWVDKDPRLCITYPAYLHLLLRRVPLLAVLRRPLEVATSLYARNGMPLDLGLGLWFLYNHHLAAVLEQSDCLLTYGAVLAAVEADPAADVLGRVASVLEQIGLQRPSDQRWQEVLANRLKPDLNRAQEALPHAVRQEINPALLDSCNRAYSAALSTGSPNVEAFRLAFEGLPRELLFVLHREERWSEVDAKAQEQDHELQTLRSELQDLEQSRQDLHQQTRELEQALRDAQRQLHALQASRSWRFTAPLRAIGDRFRGAG